jgi:hypothetical protein
LQIEIETVEAIQFHDVMTAGRTEPLRLTCERVGGELVDVIAKFAGGQHCTKDSLCAELIAAQLAANLGLPTPKPLIVNWGDEFVDAINKPDLKLKLRQSICPAYGSTLFTGGFAIWNSQRKLQSIPQKQMALAIFVFDALIGNSDRSTEKPNLMVLGETFRVFDHELAFQDFQLIVKSAAPWAITSST